MKDNKQNSINRNDGIPRSQANLVQQVRVRADKDPAFRKALKADPRAVLERDYADWFVNGKVPEGKTIMVTEEDEQTIHLMLSPKPSDFPSEVSGELLETVSGGGLKIVAEIKSHLSGRLEEPATRKQGCLSTSIMCDFKDGYPDSER